MGGCGEKHGGDTNRIHHMVVLQHVGTSILHVLYLCSEEPAARGPARN